MLKVLLYLKWENLADTRQVELFSTDPDRLTIVTSRCLSYLFIVYCHWLYINIIVFIFKQQTFEADSMFVYNKQKNGIHWRSNYQECWPFNPFYSTICVCLYLCRSWSCCVYCLEMWGSCSFYWCLWNFLQSQFKLAFHKSMDGFWLPI